MRDDLSIVPSRFEKLAEELGLAEKPDEWPGSERLREWARKHRHVFYVPENLLAAWSLGAREDG